ncbi:uncharacterized protein LOC133185841 [Saccostrea echinata]|uniref:uncharacterized protein LOC133185841 n=1 Tax=Saccostrea echinata TaxID=191078 RepID=UPI002A814521|nr:uncharacterized protein LOC133185841 [Saccostrea echinata]
MLSEILALFVVVAAILRCTVVGESAFICTKKEAGKQTVELRCPTGTEIQIKEAVYGKNKWRQCVYTVGDCTEHIDISEECCGHQNCNITVWRIYSIKCEYVTFFRVIYECVEEGDAECEDEEDPEKYDPDILDITSHFRIPLTSPKLQTSKAITQNQITSTNRLSKSIGSDPIPSSAMSTSTEEDQSNGGLTVIVLSAVAIAILLVCIIIVAFFLKKFKWQGEKECIYNIFAGWCKRHPPDGCENPDAEQPPMSRDVTSHTNKNDVNQQNRENLQKQKVATSTTRTVSRDVNHNDDCVSSQKNSTEGSNEENHYVIFESIKGEKYSNPVLQSLTAGRVVLDQKAYNATPVVSEGPGTTAV